MMDEYTITDRKTGDVRADSYDPAGRFVTEDSGRLPSDIPREGVAGTDSADRHLDEGVRGLELGDGVFFDSNVVQIVEPGDTHTRRYLFRNSRGHFFRRFHADRF